MGLADAFGVRQEKLTLKGDYPAIQDLFEKIRNVEFEAGKPMLVKNGLAYVIAFPQIDRNNQVQILGSKNKYVVSRAVASAGMDKLAANMALEQLTGGLSGFSGAFGNSKKVCMEMVTKVAEKINSLDL